MNNLNNYQHLAFNPKRHHRTDKHQRYAPQFKHNMNLPIAQNNPRFPPYEESSRLRQKYA
jgi:hypothetical protein